MQVLESVHSCSAVLSHPWCNAAAVSPQACQELVLGKLWVEGLAITNSYPCHRNIAFCATITLELI